MAGRGIPCATEQHCDAFQQFCGAKRQEMGHCIKAIVAATETAYAVSVEWPQLPRLNLDNGFAVFPITADLIDRRIAPDKTPIDTGDEFILLTGGFRELLRKLSIGGQLAYVETEYFGGVGGQGAMVCRDGQEIFPPSWPPFDTINDALNLIGMKRPKIGDCFDSAGFGEVRSNYDLLDLIVAQTRANNA